jgi:hypothetical protein
MPIITRRRPTEEEVQVSALARTSRTFDIGTLTPGGDAWQGIFYLENLSVLALTLTTNVPVRLRLYTTADQQTADLSRPWGTLPSGNAGVLLDILTAGDDTLWEFAPAMALYDPYDGGLEDPVPGSYPATVSMPASGTEGDVTVTLVYIPLEAGI